MIEYGPVDCSFEIGYVCDGIINAPRGARGGGTAGHVFPGLALGRMLRDRGHPVRFVGTEDGLEPRLVPAAGFEFHAVPARPLA